MRKIIFFIFSFLFCVQVHADAPADALSGLLLNIRTMQAEFSQTVRDKNRHSVTQSSGQMALQRPGKFRWEVQSPTKQLIIANGPRLWIYDPDLEQVTIQTVRGGTSRAPALLLSDQSLNLGKNYSVQSVPALSAIAGLKVFELSPLNQDDPLEKIKLTFIQQTIQEMQLQDRLGHTTVIRFANVRTGQAVSAKLFTFTPPPHVDVIDETKDQS